MLTLVAFVVAIGLLVAVHELGHYGVARACGVKVLRFSIGFGPRVLGWNSKRTGTEYAIGLLPLGGFVKMLDEREGIVADHERNTAFNVQSLPRRIAIVAAGPIANLIFAVFLYTLVNWSGVEQAKAILAKPVAGSVAAKAGIVGGELVIRAGFEGDDSEDVDSFDQLRWWLTRGALAHRNVQVEYSKATASASRSESIKTVFDLESLDTRIAGVGMFRSIGVLGPFSEPRLGELVAGGAAMQAGLRPGDTVLQLDQAIIADAGQLRELIRASGRGGAISPQTWLILRDGRQLVVNVLPKFQKDGPETVGRIGAFIGGPPDLTTVRYSFFAGIRRALIQTWDVSMLTLSMMGKMVTGEASLQNLSGPITIADYAGQSAAHGMTSFAAFLALISISLGVLNLLPLPVLDGGHLMYYLWESLTGKPVSEPWLDWFQKAGLVVLLVMMSVALVNDVSRLLG